MNNLREVSFKQLVKGNYYLIKNNNYTIEDTCKIGRYINYKYYKPILYNSVVFMLFDNLKDYNLNPDSNKKNRLGTASENEFSSILYTFYEIEK